MTENCGRNNLWQTEYIFSFLAFPLFFYIKISLISLFWKCEWKKIYYRRVGLFWTNFTFDLKFCQDNLLINSETCGDTYLNLNSPRNCSRTVMANPNRLEGQIFEKWSCWELKSVLFLKNLSVLLQNSDFSETWRGLAMAALPFYPKKNSREYYSNFQFKLSQVQST